MQSNGNCKAKEKNLLFLDKQFFNFSVILELTKESLLHLAAKNENLEMFTFLIEEKSNEIDLFHCNKANKTV